MFCNRCLDVIFLLALASVPMPHLIFLGLAFALMFAKMVVMSVIGFSVALLP